MRLLKVHRALIYVLILALAANIFLFYQAGKTKQEAVVIPNVAGIFGKGAEQAYDTDKKTIQSAVFSFYSDVHDKDADEWDGFYGDGPALAHWYPTREGTGGDFVLDDTKKDKGNPRVDVNATDHFANCFIWMGLLVNEAGTGEGGDPGTASVANDESALYLNEFPKSSLADNNGNPATPAGNYTWIVDGKGEVYGAYKAGNNWYVGCNGTYP